MSNLYIRFKVTHILSQAEDKWKGKRGIISDELLEELVGKCSTEGCVFTCGPKGFMLAAKKYKFSYFKCISYILII
jgi:NAD(P)H-flavin reductase